MWVSPNHPNPPPNGTAYVEPAMHGKPLVTFRRSEAVELRVSLDNYKGHDFIGIRQWERNLESGAWFPSKKGVSIRLRELPELLDVLGRVRDGDLASTDARSSREPETQGTHFMHPLGDGKPDRLRQGSELKSDPPLNARDHARARPPWDGSALPGTGGTRSDFDECEGN
jgi:Transcriptional Coactivator p15 (PC4)